MFEELPKSTLVNRFYAKNKFYKNLIICSSSANESFIKDRILAFKKVPVNISMNGLDEVSNIIDESCTRMDKNCKKLQKIKTEFNK